MFQRPQVNLYVRDVEVATRFYCDRLEFTETFRTPRQGVPEHVEVRLGEFTLGLASIDALREVHGIAVDAGPPRSELVLWTEDVDQDYARLAEAKVVTLSAPHDFLDSLRSAWIADPDGNPVQLVMRRP